MRRYRWSWRPSCRVPRWIDRVGLPAAAEREIELDERQRLVRPRRGELVARRQQALLALQKGQEIDQSGPILAARADGRIVRRVERDGELRLARLGRLQRLDRI